MRGHGRHSSECSSSELERNRGGYADVLRLESGVFAQPQLLGSPKEQSVIALQMFYKGTVQFNYGLAAALGVLLMVMAFAVTWVSLRYSRGALGA